MNLFSKNLCRETEIPLVKQINVRRKKSMPGEQLVDELLTLDEEIKISMMEYVDIFHQEIDTDCNGMETISKRQNVNCQERQIENYGEIFQEDIVKEILRL